MKIESDLNRFHKIIRKKIKNELSKFISSGELITKQSGKNITVPLQAIDLPKFIYDNKSKDGVGQGSGNQGEKLEKKETNKNEKNAGNQESDHQLEVNLSLKELANILSEELELPNIEHHGTKNIEDTDIRYSGLLRQGPESLHNYKRTYKEALKRMIATGDYNPKNPIVMPIKEDKRYRSFKETKKQSINAVIIYMMDVSGSMGDEQKEIVRLTSFWIDTWLANQYQGIERRYIIHDATAKEVNQDVFFRTQESGGTLISSAYKLALNLIRNYYLNDEWNIYLFHFSDGDNWSGNDTVECLSILEQKMMKDINLFCYGQVESRYGSGQFYRDLLKKFGENKQKISLAQMKDRESIMNSLKVFLGKGK